MTEDRATLHCAPSVHCGCRSGGWGPSPLSGSPRSARPAEATTEGCATFVGRRRQALLECQQGRHGDGGIGQVHVLIVEGAKGAGVEHSTCVYGQSCERDVSVC